jgi:formate C-acetyltransferase
MVVRRARALRYLLEHKAIQIYPDELIVGTMGTHRISAIMQPELASVFMSEELLWIDKRKTTPFEMSWRERLRLLFTVHPYWLVRNMALKAFFPRIHTMARYVAEQLNATYYLINEAGGIGHFLPNYEKLLKLGLRGYLAALDGRDGDFYRAARIACEGLTAYAHRVAATAQTLSEKERDPGRAAELKEIARICRKVPMDPPETLHEALQALWLTHMAVNLEGLNSAISFGRIDQYLYPYYQADLDAGRITPEKGRELLLLFSAKAVEHVFLLSERTSQYHGGYLVVQAAIIGGIDKEGKDATNALTYLFLDVMERFGLRDPNYQARVHKDSPPEYLKRVADVVRHGSGMPALFGDEAAMAALTSHGTPLKKRATMPWSDAWNCPCRAKASSPPMRRSSTCPCVSSWP